MTTNVYASGAFATGFVFENQVSEMLRRKGWTTISNKYYEDDLEGSVREIDMIAYKVGKVAGVSVYTSLIISCKKSDSNIWALFSRDIKLNDPNMDWWPLHIWSNEPPLAYFLNRKNISKDYHDQQLSFGVQEALSIPENEVYAFQEMEKGTGKARNDKAIYQSITSLIKAQAYEEAALNIRKKNPSIYQFNLLSLIDSDLIRLDVKGNKVIEVPVSDEHYISRYIINKDQTFSRIRFIDGKNLQSKIEDYEVLHAGNCAWVESRLNEFYEDAVQNGEKRKLLEERLWGRIKGEIQSEIYWEEDKYVKELWLDWDKKNGLAAIEVDAEESTIESLNKNKKLRKKIERALADVYRFGGNFEFQRDKIPF